MQVNCAAVGRGSVNEKPTSCGCVPDCMSHKRTANDNALKATELNVGRINQKRYASPGMEPIK